MLQKSISILIRSFASITSTTENIINFLQPSLFMFFCGAPITSRRSKIPVTLIITSTLKTNLILERGMAAEIYQYCFKLTANELKIDQSTILPIYFRFDLITILNPNQNLNREYYSPTQKNICPKKGTLQDRYRPVYIIGSSVKYRFSSRN